MRWVRIAPAPAIAAQLTEARALLAGGDVSMAAVAGRLAIPKSTLRRNLQELRH